MWRKEHLGVSTVLLQFKAMGITLEFPGATSVVKSEDYIWCMLRIAISLQGTRSDFQIQTWWMIASLCPTSPDKIRITDNAKIIDQTPSLTLLKTPYCAQAPKESCPGAFT